MIFIFIKEDKDDEFIFKIYALRGLIQYKTDIPIINIKNNENHAPSLELNVESEIGTSESFLGEKHKEFNMEEIRRIIEISLDLTRKYKRILEYIKEKLIIDRLSWSTELGLGDAAVTAIYTGLGWTLKGNLISIIKNHLVLHSLETNVVPNFNIKTFKTTFSCILRLKLGHIIIAGIKSLIVKIKDGGKNE